MNLGRLGDLTGIRGSRGIREILISLGITGIGGISRILEGLGRAIKARVVWGIRGSLVEVIIEAVRIKIEWINNLRN